MSTRFDVLSPIDGHVVATRALATHAEIDAALAAARRAQPGWRRTQVADRAALVERFCRAFLARRDAIGEELTRQMGRPIRHSPLEVDRLVERARTMAQLAGSALADLAIEPKAFTLPT